MKKSSLHRIDANNAMELSKQFFSIGDKDFYITKSEAPDIANRYDQTKTGNHDGKVTLYEIMEGMNSQTKRKPFTMKDIEAAKKTYQIAEGILNPSDVFTKFCLEYKGRFDLLFDCFKTAPQELTMEQEQLLCGNRYMQYQHDEMKLLDMNKTISAMTRVNTETADYLVVAAEHTGEVFQFSIDLLKQALKSARENGQILIVVQEMKFNLPQRKLTSYQYIADNFLELLSGKRTYKADLARFIQSNNIPMAHVDCFVDYQTNESMQRMIYELYFRNFMAAAKLMSISEDLHREGKRPLFFIIYGAAHRNGLASELSQPKEAVLQKYKSYLSAMPAVNRQSEPDFNSAFVQWSRNKAQLFKLDEHGLW